MEIIYSCCTTEDDSLECSGHDACFDQPRAGYQIACDKRARQTHDGTPAPATYHVISSKKFLAYAIGQVSSSRIQWILREAFQIRRGMLYWLISEFRVCTGGSKVRHQEQREAENVLLSLPWEGKNPEQCWAWHFLISHTSLLFVLFFKRGFSLVKHWTLLLDLLISKFRSSRRTPKEGCRGACETPGSKKCRHDASRREHCIEAEHNVRQGSWKHRLSEIQWPTWERFPHLCTRLFSSEMRPSQLSQSGLRAARLA